MTNNPEKVILLKPMKNNLYTVCASYESIPKEAGTATKHGIVISDVQTTYFYMGDINTGASTAMIRRLKWYACGIAAI